MLNSKHLIYTLLLVNVFILSTITANAQTRISSPYSRYGLGDIQTGRFGHNIGFNGIYSGFRNEASVNYLNPASYTAFDTTSFVFDIGLNSNFTSLQTENITENYNYTSLGYLLFGFPVNKWWGSSFGLVPFSSVGYKLYNSEILDSIGNVEYLYEGMGGINRFYWGNAFRPMKNLSVGANISMLFGSLDKVRAATFPDSLQFYDVRIKNSTVVGDLHINWGLQYEYDLSSDINMCAGITFSTSTQLSAKQNTLAQRFKTGSTGYEIIKDTIINITGEKGYITLPADIGAGIVINKKGEWLAGVDFAWQNWQKFNSFDQIDSLKNSLRANAGFGFYPSSAPTASYFQKVQYRFGLHYGNSYLQLKNSQIQDFGISFGMGLPLKRTKSSINIGIEIGQRGTLNDKLIREQYGKLTVGIAMFERWFLRKKYE